MKQALRVARKQSPPDLIRLPIAVAVAPDPADAKPALPTGPETIIRLPASSAPADAAPTEIAPEGPEVEGSAALARLSRFGGYRGPK